MRHAVHIAAAFYRKYGFVSLPDVSPLKLFMTAKGARRAIEASTRS